MADLIVIEYNDMHKAEEVRLMLQKMQRDYLNGHGRCSCGCQG